MSDHPSPGQRSPALPIVEISGPDGRPVLFDDAEAARAAAAERPDGLRFDATGRPLATLASEEGPVELALRGEEGSDDELRAAIRARLERVREPALHRIDELKRAGFASFDQLSREIDDLLSSSSRPELGDVFQRAIRGACEDDDSVCIRLCKLFGTCRDKILVPDTFDDVR